MYLFKKKKPSANLWANFVYSNLCIVLASVYIRVCEGVPEKEVFPVVKENKAAFNPPQKEQQLKMLPAGLSNHELKIRIKMQYLGFFFFFLSQLISLGADTSQANKEKKSCFSLRGNSEVLPYSA